MLLELGSYVLQEHAHSGASLWEEFIEVAFDPAHILAELFFTVVFDGIVIALVWGILFKQIIIPRLRKQLHQELDEAHGIDHELHLKN